MTRDRRSILAAASLAALLLVQSPDIAAGPVTLLQSESGASLVSYIIKLKQSLYNVVIYLFIFAAAGSSVTLVYQMMMGRRESIPKTVLALVAFGAGAALMALFKDFGGAAAAGGSIRRSVLAAMQVLLSGVAMINSARFAIKVMSGSDGSFFKFFFMVVVSVLGILLLQAAGSISPGVEI